MNATTERSMFTVDPTRTLRSHRKCEWCSCPMYTDELVAEIGDYRETFLVHRDCGETWRDNKRSERAEYLAGAKRLTGEINSFRVNGASS